MPVPRFTDGAVTVAVGLLKFCPADTEPRLAAVALPLLTAVPLDGAAVVPADIAACAPVLAEAVPDTLLGADTLLALVLFAEVPLTRVATDFPDTDWRDTVLEPAVLPAELLLPMPPRVETLLVKTLSEPVLRLEPCQRSSLSPPT